MVIAIAAVLVFALVLGLSLCRAASDGDEVRERFHREGWF